MQKEQKKQGKKYQKVGKEMINIVALTGRCVTTPELKTTQSGISVTSFAIAVDRKYQPQGEERKADFIDIVAWRNQAEFICKYFKKGSMIGIKGEIQTRTYEDKNGNKRKAVEIVVDHVTFCGSKSEGGSRNNVDVDPENDPLPEFADRLNGFAELGNATDDDLPF